MTRGQQEASSMEFISVFNDVLGPVMRGPSSSHTAGSYRIGRMARSLLGENPSSVTLTFDPMGSYAQVYQQQGADLAFAAGFLQWEMTDRRFPEALQEADDQGLEIKFAVNPISGKDHPNTVIIDMVSKEGNRLQVEACSVGGGAVVFRRLEDWPVRLSGKAFEYLIECDLSAETRIMDWAGKQAGLFHTSRKPQASRVLVHLQVSSEISQEALTCVRKVSGVLNTWRCDPVFYIRKGTELFTSAEQMVMLAEKKRHSLGQEALEYEAKLLGLSKDEALEEMVRRYGIMRASVNQGLAEKDLGMHLLEPSAHRVYQAENGGKLPIGGMHTRAAARAMAVMHVANSMGIVCAAPTGGAAGVIPGVVVTLVEEKKLEPEDAALLLFAASAIGLIVARRATFAAEIAGCQVEIGAAAAMGAAAVVEYAKGGARAACDAAAISLQNTMGSVCDLVQGRCEIPCHTRNASASSSAFVCADLILGGYRNPIPLDETIDAVYTVGKMLPSELRCTALGGLAQTPSAQAITRKNSHS